MSLNETPPFSPIPNNNSSINAWPKSDYVFMSSGLAVRKATVRELLITSFSWQNSNTIQDWLIPSFNYLKFMFCSKNAFNFRVRATIDKFYRDHYCMLPLLLVRSEFIWHRPINQYVGYRLCNVKTYLKIFGRKGGVSFRFRVTF